jgi:IS5 family transposase
MPPEVECIGKGKAHKPYEFGVKVSITTTNRRCKGGQFVLHAKALPGNPYDGHTLAPVIEALLRQPRLRPKPSYDRAKPLL